MSIHPVIFSGMYKHKKRENIAHSNFEKKAQEASYCPLIIMFFVFAFRLKIQWKIQIKFLNSAHVRCII